MSRDDPHPADTAEPTGFLDRLARRYPGIAKHVAILKAAWSLEKERDRSRVEIENTDFLPAALEVTQTPPSPLSRLFFGFLVSMVVVALAWAFLGKMDVVAVAGGQTIPEGRLRVIQTTEMGAIKALHVVEGQHVEAGQLLVELDPTVAEASSEQSQASLTNAQLDAARARAVIAGLEGRPGVLEAPAGADPDLVAMQRSLVETSLAEFNSELAMLRQRLGGEEAERRAALAEQQRVAQTLPILEERADAIQALADRGYASKIRSLEMQETLVDRRQSGAAAIERVASAEQQIASLRSQILQLRQARIREALTELADAKARAELASNDLAKTRRQSALQRILAPESGVVEQLQVNTIGGAVEPAAPLMTLVPDAGGTIFEARVLNRDIGFVTAGQDVSVKFDAFPFTDYGTVDGVVTSISKDAIQDEMLGLVYTAKIRLDGSVMQVSGRPVAITPGLSGQAEIKLRKRRIIDYLLSPIQRVSVEAGRER